MMSNEQIINDMLMTTGGLIDLTTLQQQLSVNAEDTQKKKRNCTDPHKVWITNLPSRITEYSVLQIVKQYGELTDFQFPVHKDGSELQGTTLGFCFVTYKTKSMADKAIKHINGQVIRHHTLVAKPAYLQDEAQPSAKCRHNTTVPSALKLGKVTKHSADSTKYLSKRDKIRKLEAELNKLSKSPISILTSSSSSKR